MIYIAQRAKENEAMTPTVLHSRLALSVALYMATAYDARGKLPTAAEVQRAHPYVGRETVRTLMARIVASDTLGIQEGGTR